MVLNKLNGEQFKELVINGAKNLRANIEEVDSLNVFPVPDGDTGTNMSRTIEGGINAVANKDEKNLGLLGKELSKGMLMGARGNSGVILSQIFRGICRGFDGKAEVNALELAEAYKVGIKQAYGAVVTPVEGTILTVFREATEAAAKAVTKDSTINEFYEAHLKQASISLKKTIELLPVLKEAGVIDSGGAGYVYIVKGMVKFLDGEKIEQELSSVASKEEGSAAPVDFSAFGADDVLQFGYCTEFILRLQNSKVDVEKFDVQTVINELNEEDIAGDSIVALKDGDVVKVHVHTKEPGLVLHKMRKYGEFLTTKIENMALQHNENLSEEEHTHKKMEHKKYAIVAVAQGDGIKEQFEAFGVDVVVSGNQTMNPSTEDFIRAFKQLDADNIIVFPNNKNIVMAAKQAAQLYKGAKVSIAMSTSIPQCYSALTMLDFSSDDLTLIMGNFNEAIRNVNTIEITTAIRSTKVHGVIIHKNDHMGIVDGKIVFAGRMKNRIIYDTLRKIKNIKDKQVVTIIYGKDVTEDEKVKNMELLKTKFPYLEFGAIDGGQSVYKYLIAVE